MKFFKFKAIFYTALIIFAFFLGGVLRKNSDKTVLTSKDAVSNYPTVYVVREIDGNIGIYLQGETYPLKTLDVIVESLPEADQKLLSDGIIVENENELLGLIEDYTG